MDHEIRESTMARFVVGRLIGLALTLLAATFLVHLALYATPGSPLGFLLGGRSLPPEAIAALESQYHLDAPFLLRYWLWLRDLLGGDLGTSIVYNQSVSSLLAPRLLNSALLIVSAAGVVIILGVTLGVISALRRGIVDTLIMVATTTGLSIPSFVAAVVLVSVFAVNLGWFPAFGSGAGILDRLWHLALPVLALALAATAYVARISRAAVISELRQDHVDTARSRGLPEGRIVFRHVLRNALIPIVTLGGITVAGLVAGAVVVESAFALNGVGAYLVLAIQQEDFPVVQAIVLFLVVAFVVTNTLVDICYGFLDPRVSLAGRRR